MCDDFYTNLLKVPDRTEGWPTIHGDLYAEMSERWMGAPNNYWTHV